MIDTLPPNVCLDGDAIRRLRESQQLTQLYLAKVVGVTTDTISRWENNRYPSVKRENALRLAEALEVEVHLILRDETGECPLEPEESSPEEKPRPRRIGLLGGVLALVALVAAGLIWFIGGAETVPAIHAERQLPPHAAPGSILPVRVRFSLPENMKGFILREHFPEGWQLIEASPPPSSLDNVDGMARWIVKPDHDHSLIAYLVQIPAEPARGGHGTFSGELVINPRGRSTSATVEGASVIALEPYHWADLNGDLRIDDGEILEAFDVVDEMSDVHLDWDTAEKIWDVGGYRWKRGEGFEAFRAPTQDREPEQPPVR